MKKILSYCTPVLLRGILCLSSLVLLTGILCLSLGSVLSNHAAADSIPVLSNSVTESLFDEKGVPTNTVCKIFERCLGEVVSTLPRAHTLAQEKFLRKGERWDTQGTNELHTKMHEQKDSLINDFKNLGMLDSITPKQKSYTYALVMGSTTETVTKRLNYAAELKQDGISFKTIVLLGGERPLRDNEKVGLPQEINTEAQMMKHLFDNHPILKDDDVILVNAPMQQHKDGTWIRPNTDDTIDYFSKIAPAAGSCLVVSNNPYTFRQTKVTQRILDQIRFPTEGAGKEASQPIDIVMLMDEFARTIYEEYRQAQKNVSFL